MSYREFKSIAEVCNRFELNIDESQNLFTDIAPVEVSELLQQILKRNIPLANAINTEKARSELLIAPTLLEIREIFHNEVGFFSGSEFNIDSELGLNGYCDFILTASREIYEIHRPVVTLVEAKNENIKGGLAQCIAEMVAAQRFNERENVTLPIFGAVTTGLIWQFLRLQGVLVWIDLQEYYIRDTAKLLGILSHPFQDYFRVRNDN
ncbi:MAG: hypothetical protein F6J90_04480 [Moorea sp. SIOASIH]|uniref:hypothetical protein n=1 Tax=Moorena sp. SIOASIH TaxID=2607817 RepID=UPI0013BC4E60|nr:hypothetical protein [Moorena sp. SIOASIH]NEO35612.1 hypothetical protein [Moorena sp. SIOASIH]